MEEPNNFPKPADSEEAFRKAFDEAFTAEIAELEKIRDFVSLSIFLKKLFNQEKFLAFLRGFDFAIKAGIEIHSIWTYCLSVLIFRLSGFPKSYLESAEDFIVYDLDKLFYDLSRADYETLPETQRDALENYKSIFPKEITPVSIENKSSTFKMQIKQILSQQSVNYKNSQQEEHKKDLLEGIEIYISYYFSMEYSEFLDKNPGFKLPSINKIKELIDSRLDGNMDYRDIASSICFAIKSTYNSQIVSQAGGAKTIYRETVLLETPETPGKQKVKIKEHVQSKQEPEITIASHECKEINDLPTKVKEKGLPEISERFEKQEIKVEKPLPTEQQSVVSGSSTTKLGSENVATQIQYNLIMPAISQKIDLPIDNPIIPKCKNMNILLIEMKKKIPSKLNTYLYPIGIYFLDKINACFFRTFDDFDFGKIKKDLLNSKNIFNFLYTLEYAKKYVKDNPSSGSGLSGCLDEIERELRNSLKSVDPQDQILSVYGNVKSRLEKMPPLSNIQNNAKENVKYLNYAYNLLATNNSLAATSKGEELPSYMIESIKEEIIKTGLEIPAVNNSPYILSQ